MNKSGFSAEVRERTHSIELACEVQVALLDLSAVDVREDAARDRTAKLIASALEAIRDEQALDALEDARRERVMELVKELAGLLDKGQA